MAEKSGTKQEKSTIKKRSSSIPKSNDKVFVNFEQGKLRTPQVTGSVWNKSDKPPDTDSSKKITKKFKIAKKSLKKKTM